MVRTPGDGGGNDQGAERRRRALLKALREFSPVSRVELAQITGISKAAVTRLTVGLIEDGLVREVGSRPSTSSGGKPRSLLGLRPSALAAVGCVVQPGLVSAALCAYDGTVENRSKIHFDPERGPTETLRHMRKAIEDVLRDNDSARPVVGIGCGLPGMVDRKGRVFASVMSGWNGVPVKELVGRELGIPVKVDNAARLNTLSEMWFGTVRGTSSAVVIDMSDGIAAGVVISGSLWRGVHSLAGEIGHTNWGSHTQECRCGGTSCWEHTAATTVLLDRLRAKGIVGGDGGRPTVDNIAARIDEPEIWDEVTRHAGHVAEGVANVVLTYDPDLIVIRGGSDRLGPQFMDLIRALVNERFSAFEGVDPYIVASALGPDADVLGAVSLVFADYWGLDSSEFN